MSPVPTPVTTFYLSICELGPPHPTSPAPSLGATLGAMALASLPSARALSKPPSDPIILLQ